MHLDIDHYSRLNLKYNPFSFLDTTELSEVLEDRIDLNALAAKMNTSDSFYIEFIGKKGRGKSSQLLKLFNEYFPSHSFVELKRGSKQSVESTSNILFVDSFQLLSIPNKWKLLKEQKRVVIAAHSSHDVLPFSRRGFTEKVNFSKLPIDSILLQSIVNSRLKLAQLDSGKSVPKIKPNYLMKLLETYQNDLRSIQLALYDEFVELNEEVYEL